MALIRLAMIELESRDWEVTRARARELGAVAMKLGEGSEGPTADAFDALAMQGAGDGQGRARVAAAIEALVVADAKAMLAYVLTAAAEMSTETGEFADATKLGQRALEAAEPLGKPSAIVLARVALGRSCLGAGDRASAQSYLAAASALVEHPYGVSKRAREALNHLAELSNAQSNDAVHGQGAVRRRR